MQCFGLTPESIRNTSIRYQTKISSPSTHFSNTQISDTGVFFAKTLLPWLLQLFALFLVPEYFCHSEYCCSDLPHLLFWRFIFHSIKYKFPVFIFEVLPTLAELMHCHFVWCLSPCWSSHILHPADCQMESYLQGSTAENQWIFWSCHYNQGNLFPSWQRTQGRRTKNLFGYRKYVFFL